jgi:hypothetical protein
MSADHALFHYSITIHTDDIVVLGCLRAICQHAQGEKNVRIAWGGTKKTEWEQANHLATFRFTAPEKREDFIHHAKRLLKGLWRQVRTSDSDPASPQGE